MILEAGPEIELAELVETIGQIEYVVHNERIEGQSLMLQIVVCVQLEHCIAEQHDYNHDQNLVSNVQLGQTISDVIN